MTRLNYNIALYALATSSIILTSCSDNDIPDADPEITDPTIAEQYYSGGVLGTSFISSSKAYEQPTPAVNNSGMFQSFNRGEKMFEKPFTANNNGGEREGLGPLYIRTSCLHCHPGYGHGKSMPNGSFNTTEVGNGYLLVVASNDSYATWLAGMPQTHAIAPFKDPIDEKKIQLKWLEFTDEWDNKFPDGESYSLRYPEVNIPREAVYVINQGYEDATTSNYEVRLESTLGIYGSGLLDAIDDADIIAQFNNLKIMIIIQIIINYLPFWLIRCFLLLHQQWPPVFDQILNTTLLAIPFAATQQSHPSPFPSSPPPIF